MLQTMRQLGAKFKSTFWVWPDKGRARYILLGRWALVLIPLWFLPWVVTVPLGLSVYFPYEPGGQSRYLRVVGPLAGTVGLSEWSSAGDIPAACFAAVVAAEDTRFYDHWGLDLQSIEGVLKERSQSPSKASRGASTISQQLVKNLYLDRERSYLRKFREAVGALALESLVSKETILTWYLNVVEFGPRVYGLEQAASHYFGRSVKDLTPFQCVALSVILPNPNRWNVSLEKRSYTRFFTRRYAVVARRMTILEQLERRDLFKVASGAPFSVGGMDRTSTPQEALPSFPDELPAAPDLIEDGWDTFGDEDARSNGGEDSGGILAAGEHSPVENEDEAEFNADEDLEAVEAAPGGSSVGDEGSGESSALRDASVDLEVMEDVETPREAEDAPLGIPEAPEIPVD